MPEWLLAEALDDPRGISLVAASDAYAHHPSRPFIKAATEHVFSDDGTANEKGERLERLVAFFVSTVPGMRPRRRLLASGSSAEHDVVATLFGETPYPLPANAPEWLIECKNTKDAVAAQQVGHFLAKMLRAGAKFGIIVAKSGLTKDEPALKYAERFLPDFCLRQGVVCLVVDAAEVLALGDAGTFRGLVDRLYEKSRFGE